MKKTRILTITSRFRKHQFSSATFPEIRFSGVWLEKCGFAIGDKILVECNEGKLHIKKTAV